MKTLFTILAAGLIALVATSPARADAAAEAFVAQILEEAEPYLNAPSEQEVFDGIGNLVDEYVDMRRVGRFVLGQFARRVTPEQMAAYQPLFEKYATEIYQNVLSEYSGQTLQVVGSVDRSERDIIVNTKIVNAAPGSGLEDVTVHWRIYRSRDGEQSLFDAGADGVWLALEQRSTFVSIISNNGGPPAGVDALIAELRKKTSD
ncbi:MAG: ABC transporter substrate-binding protein [Pseudomonadota bacterium]